MSNNQMDDKNIAIKIKRVLILTLVLNLIISSTKLIMGHISNSSSIYADGFHSLSDGFNNVVGIIAITFAYQPAAKEHPYGHKKIENVLSLFIGFILTMLAFQILLNNITNFGQNENLNINTIEILIMLATLGVNIFIARYEFKKGQDYQSTFLESDAKHTFSDVLVTSSVILSLIGIKFLGLPPFFDNIMSMVVAIIIGKIAVEIIIESSKTLIDTKVVNNKEIRSIVNSFPEIIEVSCIKSRGVATDVYLDINVVVNPLMNIEESYQLSQDIKNTIKSTTLDDLNINIIYEPEQINNIIQERSESSCQKE